MTPEQAAQLIRIAYSQWPKLAPNPEAVPIWAAALAGYDYEPALKATIEAAAAASMPPAVADVIEVLDPQHQPDTGWREAWTEIGRIVETGAFRYELQPGDFPTERHYLAAREAAQAIRTMPADKARYEFRDAWSRNHPNAAPALTTGDANR